MMNIVWLLSLSYVLLLSTGKGQESVELLSENGVPVSLAVQVEIEYLQNVSNSVVMAETWLKNYVLAHYPSINITTIIVGHSVLCNRDEQVEKSGSILPAIKNIHYSLTRWGLQREIKVSASFSSDCLGSKNEAYYRAEMAETYIKPLLAVLREMGSPYVVYPPPHLQTLSEGRIISVKSHLKSMENLGFSRLETVYLIGGGPRKEKPSNRKLFAAGSPLPPLVGIISPTPNSLPSFSPPSLLPPSPAENPISPPFLPVLAPTAEPVSPPFGPHLPPCEPSHGGGGYAGAPVGGIRNAVWCVAKPSVPAETLQEALDYACGEGGADCEAILHGGSCYFPDNVVAHASYAFNSYWQKTKNNGGGGTCGFGGTAMLVNSDPSYRHCRFILT